ncbi:hypothetical protein WJX81_007339 [Elliptochloris bilobata]|uniref:Smr domain-containing protein n=1 Tax=Elliptochloris bilobata TaxID=381761 RepID=A0AAW1QLS3_9CHLO
MLSQPTRSGRRRNRTRAAPGSERETVNSFRDDLRVQRGRWRCRQSGRTATASDLQRVAASGTRGVKKYAPPKVGSAAGGSSLAPVGIITSKGSSAESAAPSTKCRPYWPAYHASGHPVPAAEERSLPVIRLTAVLVDANPNSYPAAVHILSPPPPPMAAACDAESWDSDAPPRPAPAANAAGAGWGRASVGSANGSVSLKGRASSVSKGAEEADKLTFLVEMFNKTEAALVADVLHACGGDHDAALQSLMDMQSNAKTSTSQGSSYSASDRDDGGGSGQWAANGGEWDVSGSPNDYNFTDLTLEQKAAALRKAHPGYEAAEVEAALLAHSGDLNATAAALVLGADALAEEHVREQDRQYAEKLARELNGVDIPAAPHAGCAPAQPAMASSPASNASSQGSRGFKRRAALASVQARLRASFPDADGDVLLSMLHVANNDFGAAHKMLRDSGLKEAQGGGARAPPALPPPPPPQQMLAAVAPLAQPAAVPQSKRHLGVRRTSATFQQSPAAAESTRQKQQIYQEEMKVSGAEAASAMYRECVALACKAHAARDYAGAAGFKAKAHEHRDRAHKLAKEARHRIRQRTNKLLINEYKVDLHGLDAAQAVDALHDTLAKFAGEHSTMRLVFITGQGLHSANGQSVLRPALLAAVTSLGLEHEVSAGAVSVYIRPEGAA